MKRHEVKGFTLVELLVAIAIFAVLSALSWKVFDYIIQTKDRNAVHEQRLSQLQDTYQQILRDTVQAVPLTANINGDIQPALVLQNGRFNFSKTGVTDPLEEGFLQMNGLNISTGQMNKTISLEIPEFKPDRS